MRIIVLLIACAFISVAAADAQTKHLPRFEDYPAGRRLTGGPAPAVISGRSARQFRTQLRTQAKRGPNFAGHYTVATWGCGSGCTGFALIDARDGRVYFHPRGWMVSGVSYQDEERLQFRIDSRLLVVSGYVSESDEVGEEGKFYYEWRNKRFRLLRKTEVKIDGPPDTADFR